MGSERATLKVMAEYESFPTWVTDSQLTENTDPDELPISPALASDLMRWAQEYDETLDRQDPMASGFAGDQDEADFYQRGRDLARRLAAELSGKYAVEYFDGRTRRVVPVAS